MWWSFNPNFEPLIELQPSIGAGYSSFSLLVCTHVNDLFLLELTVDFVYQ